MARDRGKVDSFVEFKIYISLKHMKRLLNATFGFVEFKIYISLKLAMRPYFDGKSFVEFKIYISLKLYNEIKRNL